MLNYFSNLFKKVNSHINWPSHNSQSDLERFILSKNPNNAAEADLWIKIYDREITRRNSWLWSSRHGMFLWSVQNLSANTKPVDTVSTGTNGDFV